MSEPLGVPGFRGSLVVVLGGAIVLVAFLFIPVLVDGVDGNRTGRQIAGSAGWLIALLPAVAEILVVAAVLRAMVRLLRVIRLAVALTVAAGLGAVGLVMALNLLQRPAGAAALYAVGIDPASAIGPAYWIALGGFVVAFLGGLLDVLTVYGLRPMVAGLAAGVVLGTIVASGVLDIRQDAVRREVVLLDLNATGDAAFGPDFAGERTPATPDPKPRGAVAGDTEQLYSGSFGRPNCDRDALLGFVAAASPARSTMWLNAMGSPPTDVRAYVAGLTVVELRADTLVTAHRFDGDRAIPYQAALQAGTAVLVDGHGTPRIRCAGAIPLTRPRSVDKPDYLQARWPGFDAAALVTVTEASDVREFALIDKGQLFRRPVGTLGDRDQEQDPSRAVLDGGYTLKGKQTACNLSDCTKNATVTLAVIITGCPRQCGVNGRDWSGAQAMTGSSGSWTATGGVTSGFSCRDVAQPTTFSLSLRATAGTVIRGVWTAERLEGTYTKTSPASASCSAGTLSWEVSGTRG